MRETSKYKLKRKTNTEKNGTKSKTLIKPLDMTIINVWKKSIVFRDGTIMKA